MKIKINGKELNLQKNVKLLELIDGDKHNYQAARVNNRIRELNYELKEDAEIELLDLKDSNAVTIYQSTLRYLIVMAVEKVYPKAKVIFNYSVSRSIFASVSNINHAFFQEDLDLIQNELVNIINSDYPINRYTVSKEEALQYYEEIGYKDKTKILKYRPEDEVHMYECNGYKNYMFGYMLPSTGYIR